jgi:hypothetical protein
MKAYIEVPVEKELPEYYKMTVVYSENAFYIAWLASDGDRYIWTINGSE